ncbi:SGNH/GDSL hydrolase family protein [Vagococcus fluvialis]|uniref:SGNH/GDSL hydrolase family protein n=1 Tax=Vagococcus fluvialis TaxID=2738 RepID=UPI0037B75E80
MDKLFTGEKWIAYGDSVTFYDGQIYGDDSNEAGILCKGYQSYMKEYLGMEVENQGISGEITQQICRRVLQNDFKEIHGVTLFAGINNFRDYDFDKFGVVQEIGSDFDCDTFCGSYQKMIEHIITTNAQTKIVIIVPFKCFTDANSLMPKIYHDSIVKIAELYSLPYVDLYYLSGFNELNIETMFVDGEGEIYKFHPSNYGYEVISSYIIDVIKKTKLSYY